MNTTSIHRVVVALLTVAAVSAGGDDSSSSSSTPGSSSNGTSTTAVTATTTSGSSSSTTAASSTTASSSTTTASTTTVPASTTSAPTTTVAPTTTEATTTTSIPPGLPSRVPLKAGQIYRIPRSALQRGIRFTNPVEGATAVAGTGGFIITADADGAQVLVAMAQQPSARVFQDPSVGIDQLLTDQTVTDATDPAPEDYLSYFAQLPGIDAGEPQSATLAGFTGQSITWKVTAVDQGQPCLGVPDENCLLALWVPIFADGVLVDLRAGDSGTLYVLDVGTTKVIAFVSDAPEAKTIVDSFEVGA